MARSADRDGNLYMGPNTEDSPVVIEATAFKQGIVISDYQVDDDEAGTTELRGSVPTYCPQSARSYRHLW